jgi:hypothetical protein
MEPLDLLIDIERYISRRGLSHSDSIEALLNALAEDASEE